MNQNGFKLYRNNLKKVLPKEEQKRYVELSQKGDCHAQKKLFEHNLRLVFFVIDSFFPTSKIDIEDLFQTGSIGLWKAIKSYDAEKGAEFSTYAVPLIWGEIKRYTGDNISLLKVPKSLVNLMKQILEIKKTHKHLVLTTKEISKLLEVDDAEVVLAINSIQDVLSLSQPIGSSKDSEENILGDIIPDYNFSMDDILEKNEINDLMRKVINTLNEREQMVINSLYGFNGTIKTQIELADMLHIAQSNVSRINKLAIKKIRNRLIKIDGAIDLLQLENRLNYKENYINLEKNMMLVKVKTDPKK